MIPKHLDIEFKVWDTKTNKFREDVPAKKAWLDSDSWDDPEDLDPYFWQVAPTYEGRLIWLQYTGLRTTAGEKIFNGDILSGTDHEGGGPERIDYTVRSVVSWDEEYGKWIATEIGSEDKFDLYDYGLTDKIIGNIYENQDLLQIKNT